MIDFLIISTRSKKRGVVEIYPKFVIKKSKDLMIRGGDFYAIWMEDRGLWSTDEQDALQMIDQELEQYAAKHKDKFHGEVVIVQHMWDAESGMIDCWHKYCQRQMRDSFHMLDENLIFANTITTKKDYASKRLDYPLERGNIPAYDKLISTLYSEEERYKIEWAIGSIVSGDSKKIQKFMVLYGSAGTGKSTLLNIIQQLFEGYYSVFDARALGSSSNAFALEAFNSNPLVAIQHDGDLSRIEDNTRLNSLVSHEMMTVNEKFKTTYSNRFKAFLFMGTNKPVKITDAKSGLIRRLIDVSPSGNKVSPSEYNTLVKQVSFELGGIAHHCLDYYLDNKGKYDDYIPIAMMGASNDFYNFVLDSYFIFKKEDGVSLKVAWEMYKTYNEDANVLYPHSQRVFREELKNYFQDYKERYYTEDGQRFRSYYSGFRLDRFEESSSEPPEPENVELIQFEKQPSILDEVCKNCKAQYATKSGSPKSKWYEVQTTMKDLDTSKLHYFQGPKNHIVIDFDIPDEHGKKSLEKNLKEASKWPPTYAELSKSGVGIHLHYLYSGDPSTVSSLYDDHIEIKIFTGNSAIRRKLTKCNNTPIATLSSGLPLKGEKMVNFTTIKNEKALRTMIKKNLNKEYHADTRSSVGFIHKILEDAYKSDTVYDLTDMRNAVLAFAASSTNQAEACIKLVTQMEFKSALDHPPGDDEGKPIIFFDTEVFPNLFIVGWKFEGDNQKVNRMINPKPIEIEELLRFRLVGFNCRRYDNHILYARMLGYDNEQLYSLSQKIIKGSANSFFGEAYNLSYTDIYDFSSEKKSLKKFEIDLGLVHKELGLPWDQPVPKDQWEKVAAYCDNDVIATEAVFKSRASDFVARQILSDIASMSVNDTTNSLTTRIIFGKDKKPQDKFNYRNLADKHESMPYFPGYIYSFGKSTYRGEEVGEGGYVYAEPGIYSNVALLDVVSMHPTSIIQEELFGKEYTGRFKELVDARVSIKHKDFELAKNMINGALAPYLEDESKAKDLSYAIKIPINSVYGLTAARFDNAFKDKRNVDNIVAKRGALFMIDLKHFVQEKGFTVAHIKTDSIKIPDATPEIIQEVLAFGEKYGYSFEHEETYERMCLVNDAVYIAKTLGGEWTAVGAQFQVPYVFKTLFSKEPIIFQDYCETKQVTTSLYLDLVEQLEEGEEHNYKFVGKVGQFVPMIDGGGGGILLREKDGKYHAATGTKGYKWREAEIVKGLGKEDFIDKRYFAKKVDDAIDTIAKFGDSDRFLSDAPFI